MNSSRKNQWYGWIPDLPDHRDYTFRALAPKTLPDGVDLRPYMSFPVFDQGALGSCTANAIAAAFQYDQIKQGGESGMIFTPSRLFIYYNERAIEGTIRSDAGAMIRDGIKSLVKQGACPETRWPYNPMKYAVKPPIVCYRDALQNQLLTYVRVKTIPEMRNALSDGFPIVGGFTVYESFESETVSATGLVPLPEADEQLLGGHAILIVGYDHPKQLFIVRNSWGDTWGDGGYCYMPYSTPFSDMWVMSSVELHNQPSR